MLDRAFGLVGWGGTGGHAGSHVEPLSRHSSRTRYVTEGMTTSRHLVDRGLCWKSRGTVADSEMGEGESNREGTTKYQWKRTGLCSYHGTQEITHLEVQEELS